MKHVMRGSQDESHLTDSLVAEVFGKDPDYVGYD